MFNAGSEVEEKAEAPGEAPDPGVAGLSGARPLGLGVAVLPPLPPESLPFLPSAVAKKRPPSLPSVPPPPPPRLDQEVSRHTICFIVNMSFDKISYFSYI